MIDHEKMTKMLQLIEDRNEAIQAASMMMQISLSNLPPEDKYAVKCMYKDWLDSPELSLSDVGNSNMFNGSGPLAK